MATKDPKGPPLADQPRVIAVMTYDGVLALDIEQALETIGYGAWVEQGYDVLRLEADGPGRIDGGIVELRASDATSHSTVEWLTLRGIPTVVVSMDEDERREAAQIPKVIANFAKPVLVDTLLPAIFAAVEARITASPSRHDEPGAAATPAE